MSRENIIIVFGATKLSKFDYSFQDYALIKSKM